MAAHLPRAMLRQRLECIGRIAFASISLLIIAAVYAFAATAQTAQADSEIVSLMGTHSDLQFLAGRSVTIKAKVSDDVFAAGRDVTFDAAAVNNAVVAGYDVEQRIGTANDFVAAAANLKIAGTIKDDLVAGARSIRMALFGTDVAGPRVRRFQSMANTATSIT